MSHCILHIGMPKTGSTSIQDSLFFGLTNPHFRYIQLTSHPNADHYLQAIFLEDPSEHWVYQRKGYSSRKLARIRHRYRERLYQALLHTGEDQVTGIISSEYCWDYTPEQLQELHSFISRAGADITVIAYIRPIKSWIESDFQQDVKHALNPHYSKPDFSQAYILQKTNYVERLNVIERIFGADRVIVRPFKKNQLINGCVVLDFCKTLGIGFEQSKIARANEGLGADAVKLLHSYNRYARAQDSLSFADNHLLVLRLERLASEPFRLHSSMIKTLWPHIHEQNQKILEKYKIDITEDLDAADQGPCISTPDDLTCFSTRSLQWLAQQNHCAPIADEQGEMAARAVAQQVSQLVHQPAWGLRLRRLKHNLHLKWHGMIHAV